MSGLQTAILFVGDMHLGRLPSRVPAGAGTRLPAAGELGPGAAWLGTVAEAVRRNVDAVVLAGDVVNGANDLFEGAGALNAGLRQLARAGIPVLAVAGNHDTRVLPELARRGSITLLGPGGTWTFADIAPANRPPVRIVGWSFPEPHWRQSPLASAPPAAATDRVTLGVLHGDLDVVDSPYAPVSGAALAATGYAGWLLGHVHTPGEPSVTGRPFYLGSLSGLDPTETGTHGPVLVCVEAGGRVAMQRLPLAPLRWVTLELDLTDIDLGVTDLETVVYGAMADACAEDSATDDQARAVGIRLRLRGTVTDPQAVRRAAEGFAGDRACVDTGRVVAFLEKLEVGVHQQLDLRALAAHADPPGLLARRLLVLEGAGEVPGVADPDAWRRQLLDEARRRLLDIDRMAQYRPLADGLTDDEIRRDSVAAAWALLDRLHPGQGGRLAADPA